MNKSEKINRILNKNVSIEELFEFITDNDLEVALETAKSDISTEGILDVGSLDKDRRVRLAVVNNPNVGYKTLLRLSADKDCEISEIAYEKLKGENK